MLLSLKYCLKCTLNSHVYVIKLVLFFLICNHTLMTSPTHRYHTSVTVFLNFALNFFKKASYLLHLSFTSCNLLAHLY